MRDSTDRPSIEHEQPEELVDPAAKTQPAEGGREEVEQAIDAPPDSPADGDGSTRAG